MPAPGQLSPVAVQQFFDNSGRPLAGGRLELYQAGTSIPFPAYADRNLTVPLANPVVLDSAGRAPTLWLDQYAYKMILKDALGVTLWSADNIIAPLGQPIAGDGMIANLWAARASAGPTTGPFDLPGGQITFPAVQVPSAGVNVLDDYEEGTWAATDASGAGLGIGGSGGRYIKIGRFVCASVGVTYPSTANGANATIGGLPYPIGAQGNIDSAAIGFNSYGAPISLVGLSSTSTIAAFGYTGANLPNSSLSGKTIFFTLCYFAAS